jgi:molybdopterin-guanine dinucleotide biosynthesis protein MobB
VQNYKVGVIKHDGHDFTSDREGTDTYKFSGAGAVVSAIFSDTKYCINGKGCVDEKFIMERAYDLDIIILEGFKYSQYPKVEVVRGAVSKKGVCDADTLICLASDVVDKDVCKSTTVYDINDVDGVYGCIKEYFGI